MTARLTLTPANAAYARRITLPGYLQRIAAIEQAIAADLARRQLRNQVPAPLNRAVALGQGVVS